MMRSRTPDLLTGGGPGPNDRPLLSLATGFSTGDQQHRAPRGLSIEDTLLRSFGGGERLLFQPEIPLGFFSEDPLRHPYLQYQLLTKIFNQVTTRSNVSAIWLTVGFFEVTDETTRPVKLGAEIGRAEDRHVRHRMFAVVDRTNLTLTGAAPYFLASRSAVTNPATATVALDALQGMYGAVGWQIQKGTKLVIDGGPNQEIVTVLTLDPAT